MDKGGADLIADGTIQIKKGILERFTEGGLGFTDGSELSADVVVFAYVIMFSLLSNQGD